MSGSVLRFIAFQEIGVDLFQRGPQFVKDTLRIRKPESRFGALPFGNA